jgi:hypothetical protein
MRTRNKMKPRTELILSSLQDEYLKKRDIDTYQQMFSEILPYARSLILKKTAGKIFLPPDVVDSAALEATVKFMTQYEKPEFKISNSFAGMLSFKVLEAMYGPKVIAADQISSLNEHIDSGKIKNLEFGDMPETYNFTYLFRPDSAQVGEDPCNYLFNRDSDAIDSVLTVVDDLYKTCDLHTYFLVSLAIVQFIKKKKTFQRFRLKFLTTSQKEILDIALLEIKNRLANTA